MAAAQRCTGLSDWGDESFRMALRLLLDAYKHTAKLHLIGRLAIRQECIRLLSNRLRIQDELKRYPLIVHSPIKKPLVIVGLPRTGTTLLHNLLAQDPAARVPHMWELLQPSPSPDPEATTTEPRLEMAEQMVRKALALCSCCSGVGLNIIGYSSLPSIFSFLMRSSRCFPMLAWCKPTVIPRQP